MGSATSIISALADLNSDQGLHNAFYGDDSPSEVYAQAWETHPKKKPTTFEAGEFFTGLSVAIEDSRLTDSQFRVYSLLCRYTNNKTRMAWIGQAKMAEKLGHDVRTIKRAVKHLEECGYLKVLRQKNRTAAGKVCQQKNKYLMASKIGLKVE